MASKSVIAGIAVVALVVAGAGYHVLGARDVAPPSTFVLLDGSKKTTADL